MIANQLDNYQTEEKDIFIYFSLYLYFYATTKT